MISFLPHDPITESFRAYSLFIQPKSKNSQVKIIYLHHIKTNLSIISQINTYTIMHFRRFVSMISQINWFRRFVSIFAANEVCTGKIEVWDNEISGTVLSWRPRPTTTAPFWIAFVSREPNVCTSEWNGVFGIKFSPSNFRCHLLIFVFSAIYHWFNALHTPSAFTTFLHLALSVAISNNISHFSVNATIIFALPVHNSKITRCYWPSKYQYILCSRYGRYR